VTTPSPGPRQEDRRKLVSRMWLGSCALHCLCMVVWRGPIHPRGEPSSIYVGLGKGQAYSSPLATIASLSLWQAMHLFASTILVAGYHPIESEYR
jgi:hypothetical protein